MNHLVSDSSKGCISNNYKMMFVSVLLLFICHLSFSLCFNLDINFPIIYTDVLSDLQNLNDRSSYFGYSVILNSNDISPWIQIGAPRANTSAHGVIEPGGVFRCGIYGPCNFIDVDPFSSSGVDYRDKKDNAWIGGAMDIDEKIGRVVVCGHRWINRKYDDYYMEGACYWSDANDTVSSKLLPLTENGKAVIHDTASRINVFYYAQGQAGFSAHLINLENGTELVLGAPGVYNWDGTTLIYRDSPDFAPIASKLIGGRPPRKRTASYAKFSDINIANAITTTQTASFGLFGYSITSGYFFKKDELLYASGAPRSKSYVGQILVYKYAKANDQALDVKDSRQGYQFGEYFGSALAAGDINADGLDDLIVGAPFYLASKYNEGRIFVFFGSSKRSLEIPEHNSIIEGKSMGAQFGTSIMFLDDIDFDGYADVAIGAPYENEGSGVVYIYRGGPLGIHSKPSQRIIGKSIVSNIKGFGISLSNPSDMDFNSYKDLAIGAYKSGHVVLLRSKPIITLQHSILSLSPRLDHKAKTFEVRVCLWYTGIALPKEITVVRKIAVDEVLQRAHLSNTPSLENITVFEHKVTCQNISISVKQDILNRYDPITVSISQELIEQTGSDVIYVNHFNVTSVKDKFCKYCPVINKYASSKEKTIELSFALGCGSDNICTSKLNFVSSFINISSNDKFILGSSDYLNLRTTISNSGEKAYLTQLVVELPEFVYFRSIPTYCLEQNSSAIIICSIENPLYENKQKSLIFDLDVKGLSNINDKNTLNFTFKVLTSSINMNDNVFFKTLRIAWEADIALIGKTSQQSHSYGNITYGRPNFTQIYQIEKVGASPIDEVDLIIRIPTQIYGTQLINFMQLYMPEGYHAGQPINCYSDVKYIVEDSFNNIVNQITSKNEKDPSEIEESKHFAPLKRTVRQLKQELMANDTNMEFPSNRTFYINCSNSNIICSSVKCTIGPFRNKHNLAIIQIKMLLDVSSLSGLLSDKDIIIVTTDGLVIIRNPPDFIQSGNRSDFARTSSVFVGEYLEPKIDLWIIIVAIGIGLLLLLLLILGLVKAGFFQRTKRLELQALKEAEEVEQFKCDPAGNEENEECKTLNKTQRTEEQH